MDADAVKHIADRHSAKRRFSHGSKHGTQQNELDNRKSSTTCRKSSTKCTAVPGPVRLATFFVRTRSDAN
jgi:hypothetical protein